MGILAKYLRRKQSKPAPPSPQAVLRPLDEPFRGALLSMYRGEPQAGVDGKRHPIDTVSRIRPRQGIWLYQFCCDCKPSVMLEIGMAYGFSTIFFLAAIAKNQHGQLTSIDPFELSERHGIALQKSQEVRMESALRFMEKESWRACADLAGAGRQFDLVFIDGDHRFDSVMLDLNLSASLCNIGAHIILDDMWMPSVQTAVSFIRTNRADLVEARTHLENIAVFQVTSEDKRDWAHFAPFIVPTA